MCLVQDITSALRIWDFALFYAVDRNPNAPAFPQSSYSVSLSESFPLLGQVILLVASDPDGDLIEYELLYDGVSSPEYFLLESGSGKVLLRSSLRESPLTSVIFKVGKMLYSPRGHFKDACTCVSVFLFLVQTLISCFNITLNCSDTQYYHQFAWTSWLFDMLWA